MIMLVCIAVGPFRTHGLAHENPIRLVPSFSWIVWLVQGTQVPASSQDDDIVDTDTLNAPFYIRQTLRDLTAGPAGGPGLQLDGQGGQSVPSRAPDGEPGASRASGSPDKGKRIGSSSNCILGGCSTTS